jgi:hypothetical protein
MGIGRHPGLRILAAAAALAAAGCDARQGDSTAAAPGAPVVEIRDGHGTAKVAGIAFEVQDPGSSTAAHHLDAASGAAVPAPHERHEILLGKVDIRVEASGGAWELGVCGGRYGTVRPGQRVLVTASRAVLVDSVERPRQP